VTSDPQNVHIRYKACTDALNFVRSGPAAGKDGRVGRVKMMQASAETPLEIPVEKQQSQLEQIDEQMGIEQAIEWFEQQWLSDEELHKRITEDEWNEFIEALKGKLD